eukprot:GHVT01095927.1.p2 GENE.GHVT01095927.1~~GHVT01095927.1.p2  ORF type:complete len:116 (-),score=9.48 GHVT01095927.1:983-1330(-)
MNRTFVCPTAGGYVGSCSSLRSKTRTNCSPGTLELPLEHVRCSYATLDQMVPSFAMVCHERSRLPQSSHFCLCASLSPRRNSGAVAAFHAGRLAGGFVSAVVGHAQSKGQAKLLT